MPQPKNAIARTSVPEHHRRSSLAGASKWFTWSADFRRFALNLRDSGKLRRRVYIVEIPKCTPYGATYRTHLDALSVREYSSMLYFAENLMRTSPGTESYFFRGMLAPDFTPRDIRVLFALLREAMVVVARDDSAALYSPVTPERKDPGFNLHADLFLTSRLWLLFDDVPRDGSGASLLLPRKELEKLLCDLSSVPFAVAHEVSTLMSKPLNHDSFDRLYGLLHGEERPWCEALNTAMKGCVKSIPLLSGEGYLIDDRHWLHGRTAVSKRVSSRRFHRLTFGGRGISNAT